MRLTLCGSIAFYDKMRAVRDDLIVLGREVKLPPIEVLDDNGEMMPIKEYYEDCEYFRGVTNYIATLS